MLHQVFDFPELAPTRVTFVSFKHRDYLFSLSLFVVVIIVIPLIPAFSTEISVHLPCWLGVIIKHSKLAVADSAKVYLFVIVCILFLIARLAQ
jgi:hypothetical protein